MFARTHSDKRGAVASPVRASRSRSPCHGGVNERVAGAAPKDEVALKIDRDAMGNDYLDTSFGRAEKKLLHANSLCGKDKCSNQVKAHLHRDLAVVYLGGMEKREEGQSELANALALDPKLTLDPTSRPRRSKRLRGGEAATDSKAIDGVGSGTYADHRAANGSTDSSLRDAVEGSRGGRG